MQGAKRELLYFEGFEAVNEARITRFRRLTDPHARCALRLAFACL